LDADPQPGLPPHTPVSHQIRDGLYEQLQIATGISRAQPNKFVQPEQGSRNQRGSATAHLGLRHGLDCLVRDRDNEGPGP
jgi:hypothetical protein